MRKRLLKEIICIIVLQIMFMCNIGVIEPSEFSKASQGDIIIEKVEVNNMNGKIDISGMVSSENNDITAVGKRVLITVYQPGKSELSYMDQKLCDSDGKFCFIYYLLPGDPSGDYTYYIKTTWSQDKYEGFFTVDMTNTTPTVTGLRISGLPYMNRTVTAEYNYLHMGGTPEGDSDIQWFVSNKPEGPYTPVSKEYASGEKGEKLFIAEEHIYKYLKVHVKPETKDGLEGDVIESEPVYTVALPEANNVSIRESSARVGDILHSSYDYYHPKMELERYEEFGSIYKWYRIKDIYDENGIVVGNEASYKVVQDDLDKYLCFEVTPCFKEIEGEVNVGEPVRSAAIKVQKGSGSPEGSLSPPKGNNQVRVNVPVVSTHDRIEKPIDEGFKGEIKFTDMEGHWAMADVKYMVEKGLVKGRNVLETGEIQFEPEQSITRAEFASLMIRILGLELSTYNGEFSDVAAGDWYAAEVATAVQNSIVLGDNGRFRPNDPITREEMCVMVVKSLIIKGVDILFTVRTDIYADYNDISGWAQEYVGIATEKGIIKGYENNIFAPHEYTTRAQTAVIARRILDAE